MAFQVDKVIKEAIDLLEKNNIEEAKRKLKYAYEVYDRHAWLSKDGKLYEKDVYDRFSKKGVPFKSTHSFDVDVVVLQKNHKVKLIECKVIRKDFLYLYPSDYEKLYTIYCKLKTLGYMPEPIVAVKMPKRKRERLIVLKEEWMKKGFVIKIRFHQSSRRITVDWFVPRKMRNNGKK